MFLECLRGGESLALLLTAALSWDILYITTRRAFQARVDPQGCAIQDVVMSQTLDVFRCLLVTYLAAHR